MAKGIRKATEPTNDPEQLQNAPVQDDPNSLKKYELWAVKVEYKKEQDEEFNVVTVPVFTKRGDKPIEVSHIEARHAEILNAQSENSKTRYFLAK